ncbi:MAG: hypothetical protein K0S01_113 [Herbinix sp.]|jgi:hypothetical protein|nr:hypothetical protein [Herbinix sp.]
MLAYIKYMYFNTIIAMYKECVKVIEWEPYNGQNIRIYNCVNYHTGIYNLYPHGSLLLLLYI